MVQTTQTDVIYSDILMDFDIHPVKKDVVRTINETAVKRSIRNLILTGQGERLFQPNIGSNVKQYLFEPATPHTAYDIKQAIEQTINNYETRAELIGVKVTPNFTEDSYNVVIVFNIKNKPTPITLNIDLERIR